MIRGLAARAALAAPVLCVLCGLSSCSGPPPGDTAEPPGEADGRPLAAAVDARYLTHLLFAAGDGTALLGSFDQTAEGGDLRRDYQVLLAEGAGWQTLVLARDTVGVARAAWRLLPAPGMGVRVGDAGQIISLRFRDAASGDADSVRLVAGEEVSVWTGPTGQRESLGIAGVATGDGVVPGILFFRRAARALSIPLGAAEGRTFVFADSLGNGLVVHAGAAGQPASAHTWLHGIDAAWGDVTLEPPDPGRAFGQASGPAWRFEIPGTTVRGSFRPLMREDPVTGALVRMEAIVYVGTEQLHFNGFSATLPSP